MSKCYIEIFYCYTYATEIPYVMYVYKKINMEFQYVMYGSEIHPSFFKMQHEAHKRYGMCNILKKGMYQSWLRNYFEDAKVETEIYYYMSKLNRKSKVESRNQFRLMAKPFDFCAVSKFPSFAASFSYRLFIKCVCCICMYRNIK